MYNDPSQMREALAWQLFAAAGVPAVPAHLRQARDQRPLHGPVLPRRAGRQAVPQGSLRQQRRRQPLQGLLRRHRLRDARAPGRRRRRRQRPPVLQAAATRRPHLPPEDQRGRRAGRTPTTTSRELVQADRRGRPARRRRALRLRRVPRVGGGHHERAARSCAGRASTCSLGSWDNYFATPANYYLYNSGRKAAEERVHGLARTSSFIPWDYDNSFGIDYFGTAVAVHRPRRLAEQHRATTAADARAARRRTIPLVQNLLRNHDFRQYYLDHLEHLLDTEFDPDTIAAQHRRRRRARPVGARPPGRLPGVRHAVRVRRSPAGSSPTTRCTAAAASRTSSATATPRSRASSTTCGCAATAPAGSSRRCAATFPSGASGAHVHRRAWSRCPMPERAGQR